MITGKSHHRKPDPLLLLIAAVLVFAVVTTAATAGDALNFPPPAAQVRPPPVPDSGFTLASVGHDGGSVSVSLIPPHPVAQISPGEQGPIQKQETLSQVFLLLRYPW